ncbi:MAG: VanZ family protein [Clostridia bacterium]|nr:VanZ family protein [Clostridia bacterium]
MIGYSLAFTVGGITFIAFLIIAFLKKYRLSKKILIGTWIIYHTLVVAVTFFPLILDSTLISPSPVELMPLHTTWLFISCWWRGLISWQYMTVQIFGNILMTIPFGIMLPFLYKDKIKTFYISMALLFPLLIEWFQLLLGILTKTMYRTFDVDDILLNFLGVIIGYGIYCLMPKKIKKFFRT